MEEYNQIVTVIAMSMGVAWASGINLYATILMLGLMGSTGNIDLPPDLQVLSDPMVIGAAGFMYCVEFFADKIPGVDSGWDAMHTFIRVPAGAMLAAGTVGDVSSAAGIAAGILGGGMALTTHSFKAGSRVLINTSPEPVTNWTASISEDIAVFAGLWAALNHPTLFVIFMFLFIVLMIWLLPKLWKGIKSVFKAIGRFFSGKKMNESESFEPLNEQSQIDESTLKMDYKKKD
ncbi:MAG: DUF4126 domain-containing protein [gamma proteobacterium symbiont of Lucinoma myriamae]|nr:DUF4126 domain-containing protein [gamma proteobacterium symbiont of Lucinoma myriamae]MCU7819508.1 DUF4126 domain-containing protein [gamma proteobacterium symbiont of Lucinoma myriamae]